MSIIFAFRVQSFLHSKPWASAQPSLSAPQAFCWVRFHPFIRRISLTHFIGALFTHWIADSLTLWKSPVTDEHLWIAASYYSILSKQPWQSLVFLGAVVSVGATTILWSFNDLRAGNIMFDGGSICEHTHPSSPALSSLTHLLI